VTVETEGSFLSLCVPLKSVGESCTGQKYKMATSATSKITFYHGFAEIAI